MIGVRLTELREELNKSQTAVAQDLNMSPSSYSLYERNKRSPDYVTLSTIAKYYNVSMAYLLGETNQKNFVNPMIASENESEEYDPNTVSIKDLTEIERVFFKAYLQLDHEIRQKLVTHFSDALDSHRKEISVQKDIDAEVERYRLELEAERFGKTSSASDGRKRGLG